MNKYAAIQKVLRHTETARSMDRSKFEKYIRKEASLEDTMSWFFYNNMVKDEDREKISPDLFKSWIGSLGYWRSNDNL